MAFDLGNLGYKYVLLHKKGGLLVLRMLLCSWLTAWTRFRACMMGKYNRETSIPYLIYCDESLISPVHVITVYACTILAQIVLLSDAKKTSAVEKSTEWIWHALKSFGKSVKK